MPTNYIKFQRGTERAYNNLKRKDPDTLYFIYPEDDKANGALYMGSHMISGGNIIVSNATLDSLQDIVLSNVKDGQVLIYRDFKWVNGSIEDIVKEILASAGVMLGATETSDGAAGLVPAPSAGSINRFLRADGTWAEVESSSAAIEEIKEILTWQEITIE